MKDSNLRASCPAAAFTAEVREAWTTAYGVLASTMQSGSKQGVSFCMPK